MSKSKTKAELDREIEALLNKRARYMLVDATTGKDMREAHDFEIEHIRQNADKKGVATRTAPHRACERSAPSLPWQLCRDPPACPNESCRTG